MSGKDTSFLADTGMLEAVQLLNNIHPPCSDLPDAFPDQGIGEQATLASLAPHALGNAARLDAPHALAHMDPPTPWITWAMAMWNASTNQNLLHPATSPFAAQAESKVIGWLSPYFGMGGGHMCSGSTIANLTALWAARDGAGAKRVIASEDAHISVPKAAKILGLEYVPVATNQRGELLVDEVGRLDDACLVLTAGTTNTGAIDPMVLAGKASWTHVDAAWAGPLRLSPRYSPLLNELEKADSVAVSAHKWLFQPKDAAIVMFREPQRAESAISFGGSYLTAPNVGVQGSRGANALPLLATLMAWGKQGLTTRIEHTMTLAETLAERLSLTPDIELWGTPVTGVTLLRPQNQSVTDFYASLPEGMFSTCKVRGESWVRSVAANPMADIDVIMTHVENALRA